MANASTNPRPRDPSGDYIAMLPFWDMVETILDGTDAMRAAGEKYLPKFPQESQSDYDYRSANAKFTNIYRDIVENLSAKPFADEVSLKEESETPAIKALIEDIDGRGNHLHVFAADTFFAGVNFAIDWILVDYTKTKPSTDLRVRTVQDEKNQKLRPYWVHVHAKKMLGVYTAVDGGKEIFVHARISEPVKVRDGWGEKTICRIRIFNRNPIFDTETQRIIGYQPATWELWEETDGGDKMVDGGPVSIKVIPIVPFITGRRIGGSWQFVPPMKDCAFLQIEHFQQETNLKSAKEMTAFPMLAGNGVQPPLDANGMLKPIPVGPKSVLFALPIADTGQHGEWTFIEPTAESLKFLASEVEATAKELRELGRQPLIETMTTVIVAGMNAQKANSAIQAWSLKLKDALENALKLTAMWLNESMEPEVRVKTDFTLDTEADDVPQTLISMRKNGDLSQATLWDEMKRRGILSPEFVGDDEKERLAEEGPSDPTEEDIAAALGQQPQPIAA